MNPIVALALFGWIPLSIAAFAVFTPRVATMLTVIGGWLFLPVASYDLPGVPDYTKPVAVSLGALSGLLLFGRRYLAGLRPGRHDLLAIGWCVVPAASSLANGHGIYDAVSAVLARSIDWGIPYLIGRAVFRDFAALGQLARGVFAGGLVYVPFCLYEVRMSPQLHATVYGFAQHSFAQTIRMEGYRPMVFMDHGLMVALWMGIATLAGFEMWRRGGMQRLAQLPAGPLLLMLLATTILCKSMGALVLLAVGLAVLAAARSLRSKLPVYVLVVFPVIFVYARIGLEWQAGGVVELIRQYAPDRASSLEYRIACEQFTLSSIWPHRWLGWSAWGVRTAADQFEGTVALDSAWLITMCSFGLIGLVLFFGVHLAPILTLLRRLSVNELLGRRATGAMAVVAGLCLFVCDCLFNAMINPVYIVMLGSIASLAAGPPAPPSTGPIRSLPHKRARRRVVHALC